jgi:hypothetical protein
MEYSTGGLGDPKKQKQIKYISGKTLGELIEQYNLYGNTAGDAYNALDNIRDQKKSILSASGKPLSVQDILKEFDRKISKISLKDAEGADNLATQRNELLRRKQQFINSVTFDKNFTPLQIDFDEVERLKRNVGGDISDNKFNADAIQTAKSDVARSTYNVYKDAFNSLDPRLKQLGKDESAIMTARELFENNSARESARNNMSLSDYISGGAALGATANPLLAAGVLVGKKAMESPLGVKAISKTMQGVGNVVSNAKMPKAVKPITTGAYNLGRADRILNPYAAKPEKPQSPQQSQPQSVSQLKNPYNAFTTAKAKTIKQPKYTVRTSNIQPYKGTAFGKNFELKKSNNY